MNYISVLFAIGYLTLSPIIVVYSGIVYKVYGYLKLGTWNLELGTWNLEFGIWNSELREAKHEQRVTENEVRS